MISQQTVSGVKSESARICTLADDRPSWGAAARPATLAVILALFALALAGLGRESLWADEAWSIWVAGGSWSSLSTHVAADVHPPLYFVLLKLWVGLAGESVYAVRWLSSAFGLVGLAITFALGRRLHNGWLGICAVIWLGAHGFLLYYLREVRMYSLLFTTAALSMWMYWQWLRRPSLRSFVAYAATTALLAYLHYCGPLVVIAQGLHLAWVAPRRLLGWLTAVGLALILFAPWLPTLSAQVAANPGGPHQSYTTTDWTSAHHLIWVLSGGAGLWMLAILGLGLSLALRGSRRTELGMLWICCLTPPLILMVVNAWVAPLYEPRNVITVLPALGLLVAATVRTLHWPPLIAGALLISVAVNLAAAAHLRPSKPDWAAAFERVIDQRGADTPTLLKIVEPGSVEAYYARTLPLQNGATITLPAQPLAPTAIRALVDERPASSPLWVILPVNVAESWAAIEQLSRTRHVGFRQTVEYMLFYRFDPDAGDKLRFAFGDRLDYASDQFAVSHIARAGESLCFAARLTVRNRLDGAYSYGLHLVDPSSRLVAQSDAGLGDPPVGAMIELSPCLALPANLPPGAYPAHLVVYRWADGVRAPVLERDVSWGDALVLAVVEVQS